MSTIYDFNFDDWAALAKSDPQAFEEKRRAVIEQVIAAAPGRQQARLRGLQWRLDIERGQCHHPLVSCTRMFNKMWAAVYGEGGLVDALNGNAPPAESALAPILPFASGKRTPEKDLIARS